MKPSFVATTTASIAMIEATPSFRIGAGLLSLPLGWSANDLVYKTRVAVKNHPLQATEIAVAALVLFACSLDGRGDVDARMARFNTFLVGLLDYACRVAGADAKCARRSQDLLHSVFVRQYHQYARNSHKTACAGVLQRQPAAELEAA